MHPDQGQIVRANGIDAYYATKGEGPWLVMSHSLACDHTMWDPQLDLFSRKFRVLRYDTRGHGRTSATEGSYSLELLAEYLKGLLDALAIRQAHFVGLSMGGMIGQVFALKYPASLKTLVLCDTTSRWPAPAAPVWAERMDTARREGLSALAASTLERWFTEAFRKAEPGTMQRFGKLIASTSVAGYVGCSEALLRINATDRLKELCVPALVVVGERDVGTPIAMARAIQENLRGSELAVIENAAHFPNVEQPEPFSKAVLTFLEKHENVASKPTAEGDQGLTAETHQ